MPIQVFLNIEVQICKYQVLLERNTVISSNFLLWKGTVSVEFWENCPKLCGNFAFPQNLHTRKLGEIMNFLGVCFEWIILVISDFYNRGTEHKLEAFVLNFWVDLELGVNHFLEKPNKLYGSYSQKILTLLVIMKTVSSFYNIVLYKNNQILFYQTIRFVTKGLYWKIIEFWWFLFQSITFCYF